MEGVGELGVIVLAARAKPHRDVDRVAESLARSSLVLAAGAGVEGEAMDAKEKNLGIAVEDVLCAIAVVDVPVDDENAVQLVFGLGMVGGQRDAIEKAKTHALRGGGMVARGPD